MGIKQDIELFLIYEDNKIKWRDPLRHRRDRPRIETFRKPSKVIFNGKHDIARVLSLLLTGNFYTKIIFKDGDDTNTSLDNLETEMVLMDGTKKIISIKEKIK